MTLSDAILRYKAKGFSEAVALLNAKKLVRSAGSIWTLSFQKSFDKAWNTPVKQKGIVFSIKGQGGSQDQRVSFFKSLLKSCKFDPTSWTKFGLHVKIEGSEKRPTPIKLALSLLEQHGFTKSYRLPMSDRFSDTNSERSVTFYRDKYDNTANTVSQKSSNGKNDFYILNVIVNLENSDRSKLSSIESKLDEKYRKALDKAENGKIKSVYKDKPYQLRLGAFIKKMKGTNSVRMEKLSDFEYKEQWVSEIEKALKAGIKLDPEITAEYTSTVKSAGALYKLPTSSKSYKTITLTIEKIKVLKRNLKKGDVIVKADDGTKFVLTSNPKKTLVQSSFPCGASLKSTLEVWPLFCKKI